MWDEHQEFLRSSLERLLVPKSMIGIMGTILGTISVFRLIEHSIKFSIASTIGVLISYYDKFLDVSLFWLRPLASKLIFMLSSFFEIDLELQPHWRHIFILLLVYFFRDAATDLKKGYYGSSVFLITWGGLVAIVGSVLSGAIDAERGWGAAFSVAFVPVLAAFIYTLLRRVWHASFLLEKDGETPPELIKDKNHTAAWLGSFYATFKRSGTRTLAASVVITALLLIPSFRSLPDPGIFAFALLVFFLAAYWMTLGWRRAVDHSDRDTHWTSLYWHQSATLMGSSMLAVFFYVAVVLVLNAGLQFAGL